MSLELQYRINSDPRLKQFLRENSYWYKYLNRSNTYLKPFISDMKDKYKLIYLYFAEQRLSCTAMFYAVSLK